MPTDGDDRHALIIDRNKCVVYELYQAAQCNNAWTRFANDGVGLHVDRTAALRATRRPTLPDCRFLKG